MRQKTAKLVAEGKTEQTIITSDQTDKLLGPAPYIREDEQEKDEIEIATGLAWTEEKR